MATRGRQNWTYVPCDFLNTYAFQTVRRDCITAPPPPLSPNRYPRLGTQWFSSGAGSATRTEFPGENAYGILGVAETTSFAEIKASFRKLAKQTHPDLAESKNDSSESSKNFVRILAAYELR
ncbi:chaperone protein dnaJ 50-like [Hibiscus syriacus]|uniref:chaperone protein dnaJ 50-like n=1 Tax=Hibiscus syriacus TaxID=106335 RepID=UPI0019211D7A|nr:chaperone protein dnaJ 50-like [Hibiscus syriacus]